jgi:exodeoxyribonuclease III
MRITTWNVNGYRAVLRKKALSWVSEVNPDIMGFQEIKLKLEQITEEQATIEPYESTWFSAERPGYSGVVTFHKPEVNQFEKGIGIEKFDKEGRVIRLKCDDFYLYNIYFPNGGSENKRVPFKLDFYEALLNICDALHKKDENIIITGDFNTAHEEIDLANPESNKENTGFLPEEREWIDKYLDHGFVDAYRQLYPDKIEYTYWTYRFNSRARNVGWRLDYFLVSDGLMDRVKDVEIHSNIIGSDHCPVSLILED